MQSTNRSSNDSVAEILEKCRVRLARGETIESCLAFYPDHADELRELLPLAARVQQLSHGPDLNYAALARRRFQTTLAAARESQARERATSNRGLFGFLGRLALPLALVLVLSLSGIGLVHASDSSLPDSPLYTVKRASENVGQILQRTPEGRIEYAIVLANRRWNELVVAEKLQKPAALRLILAQQMAYATDLATDQLLQTTGPHHDQLLNQLRQLIPVEVRALYPLGNAHETAVALAGQRYQQQVLADQQRLGLK
jgi:Domain of unknown function (DUF5667)